MKTKTTERLRLWVVASITGGVMLFSSRSTAKKCAGGAKVRSMVESRPGDVVLSREDASAILNALNRTNRPDVVILRALLRGGR